MEKEITKTLTYFAYFEYAPTFDELYTYVSCKTSQKKLRGAIEKLIYTHKITENEHKYTLGGYGTLLQKTVKKERITTLKLQKIQGYIRFLSRFKSIQFIGISGSASMMNATLADDIDLFIISTEKKLWTARFLALFIASSMGKRRTRKGLDVKDKICLNLFFDETELMIPKEKRNIYTAHEVLQLKSLTNKNRVYERFLRENKWVYDYFPNAKKYALKEVSRTKKHFFTETLFEKILKKVQLYLIKKHQTTELIYQNQLWFFPKDVQKKLEQKKIM